MSMQSIRLEKLDGVYDIQPLIPAAFNGLEIFLILAITFSVTAYVIWLNFYSTKGQAKRNIKKIHSLYAENKITTHDAIYQLSFQLQLALKLKQLKSEIPLPAAVAKHKNRWDAFSQNFSDSRYKKNDNSKTDLDILFTDSLFWLKVWP